MLSVCERCPHRLAQHDASSICSRPFGVAAPPGSWVENHQSVLVAFAGARMFLLLRLLPISPFSAAAPVHPL